MKPNRAKPRHSKSIRPAKMRKKKRRAEPSQRSPIRPPTDQNIAPFGRRCSRFMRIHRASNRCGCERPFDELTLRGTLTPADVPTHIV
eukprot:9435016-Pyramimonas_sp.AAC.1